MLSLKAENFCESTRPLHFFSKIIGLTSFSIELQKGKFKVFTTVFNMCCILFPTVWCIFACIYSIHSLDIIEEHLERLNVSEVFEKSVIFIMLGFLFITILSNWWIFAMKSYFEVIFDTLKEVDDELEVLKVSVNFRRHKLLTFVLIVTIKVLVLANVLVSYHIVMAYKQHFLLWCAALATMIIYMESGIFTFYHFMFFMWSVKLRYENINLFIKKHFIDTKSISERDGNDNLHKTSVLHDKLVDISECLNRCYGVPVSYGRF